LERDGAVGRVIKLTYKKMRATSVALIFLYIPQEIG
jgi:hypothetical protein